MTNITKWIVKKTGDKFLVDITNDIARVEAKLTDIYNNLNDAQLLIAENQRQQLVKYQEFNDKIRNSGVIHLSESEIITKIFSGIKIYLDPRDIAVVPHLVLDGVWEKNITTAWLSLVKPNDVVLDIGANFGYYGVLAAQRSDKKNSKIIFFEANPNLIPYINKTLSVNWMNEQSKVENVAITDREGKVILNVWKDYIGSSSLKTAEQLDEYMHNKMHLETASAISIQGTTIDSYCKKNKILKVDLVKIDIEGLEDKAYQGMRKIVKASPNLTLFVEFTKDGYKKPKEFYNQMLEDFGYVYLIDENGNISAAKNTNYESVIGNPDDWVMPIFSKNDKLASS